MILRSIAFGAICALVACSHGTKYIDDPWGEGLALNGFHPYSTVEKGTYHEKLEWAFDQLSRLEQGYPEEDSPFQWSASYFKFSLGERLSELKAHFKTDSKEKGDAFPVHPEFTRISGKVIAAYRVAHEFDDLARRNILVEPDIEKALNIKEEIRKFVIDLEANYFFARHPASAVAQKALDQYQFFASLEFVKSRLIDLEDHTPAIFDQKQRVAEAHVWLRSYKSKYRGPNYKKLGERLSSYYGDLIKRLEEFGTFDDPKVNNVIFHVGSLDQFAFGSDDWSAARKEISKRGRNISGVDFKNEWRFLEDLYDRVPRPTVGYHGKESYDVALRVQLGFESFEYFWRQRMPQFIR